MKKQIISLIILAMLPLVANADAVEIDGIYYNLVTKIKSAEVTSNPNEYSGDVVIPDTVEYNGVQYSVTSIGSFAFSECIGLTSVTIGNSVTNIGDCTFQGCSGLTSVTIGNSVTTIGEHAFYICTGLTSITIPNSVISIGQSAFENCSGLTSVHISDLSAWCRILFYDFESNPLFYAHRLYLSGEEIKDLVIPNSVTSIGEFAFKGCSGLTSVTIPNYVTSIGNYAFEGCSDLMSVTIGNSVTNIGDYAFRNCSGLTSFTIGNSVTSIGESAFLGCSALTSVHISDLSAWCKILLNGFYSNPLSYAHHLYLSGEEIKDLVIPNSVTNIRNYAFQGCSGLTSVTISNSVTSIGEHAFVDCSGLTSVTIPNSVTCIGRYAFAHCSGLKNVTIPNSVSSLENSAFYNCSGLTSVKFGNSITSIGEYAFRNCSGLTNVTIPNSVTSIGMCAFYDNSSLTSVIIGCGVNTINKSAFAECPELTDVYCYAEKVPSTSSDAFLGSLIEYATLHVPAASVNDYKAMEPWKNFKSVVATDGTTPTPPEVKKCATPVITYKDGKLKFTCETEGVEYVSDVTVADAKKYYTSEVNLGTTYKVSVVAMKTGYDNSDAATMEINVGGPGAGPVGDLNKDGKVDATDLTKMIDILLGR